MGLFQGHNNKPNLVLFRLQFILFYYFRLLWKVTGHGVCVWMEWGN